MSHERVAAWPEPAVAHDMNNHAMPARDALDLALHRTGIAIDKDLKHGFFSSHSFP
jgi:hypothetical protein